MNNGNDAKEEEKTKAILGLTKKDLKPEETKVDEEKTKIILKYNIDVNNTSTDVNYINKKDVQGNNNIQNQENINLYNPQNNQNGVALNNGYHIQNNNCFNNNNFNNMQNNNSNNNPCFGMINMNCLMNNIQMNYPMNNMNNNNFMNNGINNCFPNINIVNNMNNNNFINNGINNCFQNNNTMNNMNNSLMNNIHNDCFPNGNMMNNFMSNSMNNFMSNSMNSLNIIIINNKDSNMNMTNNMMVNNCNNNINNNINMIVNSMNGMNNNMMMNNINNNMMMNNINNNMVGNNFMDNNIQPMNTNKSNNSNSSNNSMNHQVNNLLNEVILKCNINNNGNFNNMNLNNNMIGINNNIRFDPDFDFLVNENGCRIPLDKFDSNLDSDFNPAYPRMTGPIGYLKGYTIPKGWKGFGLNVINQYEDNDWLGRCNSPREWYIGYHGTKNKGSINGIINQGFRRGNGQTHQKSNNSNPLTNKEYPLCGKGVYFTPDIEEAKKYTEPIEYNGYKYRVVFMCRINPYKTRIHSNPNEPLNSLRDYFIVEGDELNDFYGIKRDNEVRPYRILLLRV